jgi:HAD superfamily hydrolase (TIGR01509 family)
MDGVLCDSEAFISAAAIRMFQERYNQTVQKEDFIPFIGAGENRFIGGVAEKYGIQWNQEADKAETYRLYAECVKGHLQALPGVIDFIKKASRAGMLLAIATSADAFKLKVNLTEMGLEQSWFNALVNGLEIEHKKPAPDIFIEAAKRLGLDPAECIVFEDAINGVQAAKSAGAHCVGITSSFTASELMNAGADTTSPGFLDFSPPSFD